MIISCAITGQAGAHTLLLTFVVCYRDSFTGGNICQTGHVQSDVMWLSGAVRRLPIPEIWLLEAAEANKLEIKSTRGNVM
jgi:hypothetical protein